MYVTIEARVKWAQGYGDFPNWVKLTLPGDLAQRNLLLRNTGRQVAGGPGTPVPDPELERDFAVAKNLVEDVLSRHLEERRGFDSFTSRFRVRRVEKGDLVERLTIRDFFVSPAWADGPPSCHLRREMTAELRTYKDKRRSYVSWGSQTGRTS